MSERKTIRVYIEDARLSYPVLDEPKQIMGKGDTFYQATFLIAPDNPSVARIKKAISEVAKSFFDEKVAQSILTRGDKIPLKKGDDKPNPPAGYEGMYYISAKSKRMPDYRDANPKIRLNDRDEIRGKFVPGYRVNAYVDIFPYEYREGSAIISRGVSSGLVSVQYVRRDETFGGGARLADDAYPDCSENNSAGYADDDLPF